MPGILMLTAASGVVTKTVVAKAVAKAAAFYCVAKLRKR